MKLNHLIISLLCTFGITMTLKAVGQSPQYTVYAGFTYRPGIQVGAEMCFPISGKWQATGGLRLARRSTNFNNPLSPEYLSFTTIELPLSVQYRVRINEHAYIAANGGISFGRNIGESHHYNTKVHFKDATSLPENEPWLTPYMIIPFVGVEAGTRHYFARLGLERSVVPVTRELARKRYGNYQYSGFMLSAGYRF